MTSNHLCGAMVGQLILVQCNLRIESYWFLLLQSLHIDSVGRCLHLKSVLFSREPAQALLMKD